MPPVLDEIEIKRRNKMNKTYKTPMAEIGVLNVKDMITLSGGGGNISNGASDGDWFVDGGMLG